MLVSNLENICLMSSNRGCGCEMQGRDLNKSAPPPPPPETPEEMCMELITEGQLQPQLSLYLMHTIIQYILVRYVHCDGSLLELCWPIFGDVEVQCLKVDRSLCWLIAENWVAHCLNADGSLLDNGYVVAQCWKCGGSLLEIRWLIVGDVVTHCWGCGDSLSKMW